MERAMASKRADNGRLAFGWLPLGIDTFAMDNSGMDKEDVRRACAGVDGDCPLAAHAPASAVSSCPTVSHR